MLQILKKKYVFSNTYQSEAKVLAVIQILIGLVCIPILAYHIHLYFATPNFRSGNNWPFIESNWKEQNLIARFLMWGSDKSLLLVTIPYTNCLAMTGILLLIGSYKRVSELLQVWIIFSIIFCMFDLVLILPAASYAENKVILVFAYIHSYIQKIYSFWIVKAFVFELVEEKANEQEMDPDTGRRGSRKY